MNLRSPGNQHRAPPGAAFQQRQDVFAAPSVHKFRVPYARALYAAAIAALLSACTSALARAPRRSRRMKRLPLLVAQDAEPRTNCP